MNVNTETNSYIDELQRYVGQHTYVRLADLLSNEHSWQPEDVYSAIAHGNLYCDLTKEDLTKSSKCMVFVDRLTKELVELAKESDGRSYIDTIHTIKPGDNVTWNSGVYLIERIEQENIILSSESGKSLNIPTSRFNEILRDEISVIHKDSPDFDIEVVLPPLTKKQKDRLITDIIAIRTALEHDTPPGPEESRLRKLYFEVKKRGGLRCNIAAVASPKTYARGNFDIKAPPDAKERALETLRAGRKADPPIRVGDCWVNYSTESRDNYLPAVSKTTFYELDSEISPEEKAEAERGKKGAYQKKNRTGARQSDSILLADAAWKLAGIDSTQVEMMLFDEQYGFVFKARTLVRLTDQYSHIPLAISFSLNPASSLTSLALLFACIKRYQRVPSGLLYDGGTEFNNTDIDLLCATLGIMPINRRTWAGRDDAVLERQNKDFDDRFLHFLKGNTRQLKNPRGLDPSKNPENHAIWTPHDFAEEAERYCYEIYPNLHNEDLHATPQELYQYSKDAFGLPSRIIIPDEQTLAGLLPATRPRQLCANPQKGCQYRGVKYWHTKYREPRVAFKKFDSHSIPFDISGLWMFIDRYWVKCISDRHSELFGMSEVERKLISEMYYEKRGRTAAGRVCNADILAKYRKTVREREEYLQAIRQAEISGSILFSGLAVSNSVPAGATGASILTESLKKAHTGRRIIPDYAETT